MFVTKMSDNSNLTKERTQKKATKFWTYVEIVGR